MIAWRMARNRDFSEEAYTQLIDPCLWAPCLLMQVTSLSTIGMLLRLSPPLLRRFFEPCTSSPHLFLSLGSACRLSTLPTPRNPLTILPFPSSQAALWRMTRNQAPFRACRLCSASSVAAGISTPCKRRRQMSCVRPSKQVQPHEYKR